MGIRKTKHIISFSLIFIMIFSMMPTYAANGTVSKKGETAGKAVVSVEAFTIGGGYLIEPVAVDIIEGENTAQFFDRVLGEHGYTYKNTGKLSEGFYLSSLHGGILPIEAKIPKIIERELDKSGYFISYDDIYDGGLGEFSYTRGAGWMYCVNNIFPNVGLSDFYLSDGDVVRLQFTLAYGADIGGAYAVGSDVSSYYAAADRDELTRLIAEKGIKNVPEGALKIALKANATQYEVDVSAGIMKAYGEKEITDANEEVLLKASKSEIYESQVTTIYCTSGSKDTEAFWSSSDESVAEIVYGNGTSKATIKAVSPGEAYISAHTLSGAAADCKVKVLPRFFTASLKDGTILEVDEDRILVPEGEDIIIISLKSGGKIQNFENGIFIEHDNGAPGIYTLHLEDIKRDNEGPGFFLKVMNAMMESEKRNLARFRDTEKYVTGTYSSLEIYEGDEFAHVDISWQGNSAGLTDINASKADIYRPVNLSNHRQDFVMHKNVKECEITFTVNENTKNVYLQDENLSTLQNKLSKKGNLYSFKISEDDFNEEITLKRNLILETEDGYTRTIALNISRRASGIDSPDRVEGYLCIGSQYSDGGNQLTGIYGLYPEKSLIGMSYWWSPISLGNFGGYVTYYYEEPIENNPKNPYGIDFIVYGNSNGGEGFSEPGNVLVSEDGETWYTLAGSEHYEDSTIWDYQVEYEKIPEGTKINDVRSKYWYPSRENYPLHNWNEEDTKITVQGVAISNGTKAAYTAFGYADVRVNTLGSWGTGETGDINGAAKNPYLETTSQKGINAPEKMEAIYEGAGDCFDLAWAVDKEGLPVELSKIHYIKVQTASPPTVISSFGEKSTEVNTVARAVPSDSAAGKSRAPESIKIAGKEIELQKGKYIYDAEAEGIFTVEVDVKPQSNVYINNLRGKSRTFGSAPNKEIIRIIVQNEYSEPLIYYIRLNSSLNRSEIPGFFSIFLKDGTPVEITGRRLLLPEGEDTIVIKADSDVIVRDSYDENKIYKRDKGGETYTLNINDVVLQGESLSYFLKYFNAGIAIANKKTVGIENIKYETGAYSSLDISCGSVSYTVNISWQANLPELEELSAIGADFYTPFVLSSPEHYLVMNKNAAETEIIFTPSEEARNVFLQDDENSTINGALTQKGNRYSFKVKNDEFKEKTELRRSLILETKEGNKQTISFVIAKRSENIDSPDKIAGYLCVGSQYSDGGNRLTGTYGLYPEKSLIGMAYWWSPISLGNFGGYATYYYEKPIEDDPKNPYGIDFIVYGNSNGGPGFSEPGNVLVSQDGEAWYTLAGSEHYENRTQWDYEVTYRRNDQGTKANDAEIRYWFPSKSNYPLHNWENEDKIMVKGVAIGDGMEAYYPPFGYADVRINSLSSWGTGENGAADGRAKNPYLKVTQQTGLIKPEDMDKIYEGAGDCFDLAWAVDENGLPVKLSKVHYIKIQTATPLTPPYGAIGEKSTEVNAVARVVSSGKNAGLSSVPEKITVGGYDIKLEDGVYVYSVDLDGPFEVCVESLPESNVYINNHRGTVRSFPIRQNKRIIRIIVQDGEKAPLIYYIKINSADFSKDDAVKALQVFSGSENTVKRGAIVRALYDLSGKPESSDVYPDRYTEDVNWAAGIGLIKGYGGDLWLDRAITNEELAVIIYSYSEYLSTGFCRDNDIEKYSDYNDVASWAMRAVKWSAGSGYMLQTDEGKLNPKGYTSPDEAAEILYRLFSGK